MDLRIATKFRDTLRIDACFRIAKMVGVGAWR
jgi:hypothetical protein